MKIVKPSVEILRHTMDPERLIECCGRVCYKSEDRITDDSAGAFIRMIIKRGHLSVIEHASATIQFVIDRGVSHELVRHRLASYCLAGDTEVVAYRHPGASARTQKKWTVAQLYSWQTDPKRKGRLQLIRLRSVDNEGCLVPGTISKVLKTGRQAVFRVMTRSGRSIEATAGHRFMICPGAWGRLRDMRVGDRIVANGGVVGMHTPGSIEKLRRSKLGANNPMWRGEQVGPGGGREC